MLVDAKPFDKLPKRAENIKRIDKIEAQPYCKTNQYGQNEGNNLTVCHHGAKDADGGKSRPQKEQANVRPPHCPHVQIAFWIAQKIYGNEVDKGRQQRNK